VSTYPLSNKHAISALQSIVENNDVPLQVKLNAVDKLEVIAISSSLNPDTGNVKGTAIESLRNISSNPNVPNEIKINILDFLASLPK